MATIDSGLLLTSTMPQSLRDFYSAQLLDVLRSQTIFQQLALENFDLAALGTKKMVLTKVYDLHPAIGALTEGEPWLTGAFLNSKQFDFTIREHGNTLKWNKFHAAVQYWNDNQMQSLVRDKLGRNLVESVELMARNAYCDPTHNANLHFAGVATSLIELTNTDVLIPDYAELSHTNLESRNAVALNQGADVVCIAHPRQIRDIRKDAGSDWVDKMQYAQPALFRGAEAGTMGGVRYVKNNFCRLPNAGEVSVQTTLSHAPNAGEGGPDSDDISGYTNYVDVTSEAGFVAGMEVAIHNAGYAGFIAGDPCPADDPEAEHRVILATAANKLYFTEPLGAAHASGDYITEARDIYAAVMVAGPGMVYGVAQQPTLLTPPVIDDAMRIFRLTWYGVFDYTLLQDDYVEVYLSAASTANFGEA